MQHREVREAKGRSGGNKPVDWARLHTLPAPFPPPCGGKRWEKVMGDLKTLRPPGADGAGGGGKGGKRGKFDSLIREITTKFDSFPDEPLPGGGGTGRNKRASQKDGAADFIGYTFKPQRAPNVQSQMSPRNK